jgi:NAD(P)-dependent dehydrogenase (short-subunit alcohol dehydrogenase family)
MARYGVRSNCISPFAWSRMTGCHPDRHPGAEGAGREAEADDAGQDRAVAVFLASDAAKDVTGQIFAVRNNEIFLMSQPRPIRGLHRAGGWTPEALAEEVGPAFRSMLVPLERSGDVFSWDPV